MAARQLTKLTAEEFFGLPDPPGTRTELVDGGIVEMSPAGGEHGEIAAIAIGRFVSFVVPRKLGKIYSSETGFIVKRNPDRVRAPDLAFITRSRLPGGWSPKDFIPFAPDFVIEVVSPDDEPKEIDERVADWLAAGTPIVWLAYPTTQSIIIKRGPDQTERRTGDDPLDVEPVLPGFRCKVSDLFPDD